MKWPTLTRREGLRQMLRACLYGAAAQTWPGFAQEMLSGQSLSLAQMTEPLTQGARLLPRDVKILAPLLADNGSLVPLTVQVQNPMTPQDHVTHLYLLSPRNPVTRMAVFRLGPWNGRAEVSTRLRLAGTQQVVALARLSNGEFRYGQMEIFVTESACVDAS
jgi:sulfur-oxidizing protein SoxY